METAVTAPDALALDWRPSTSDTVEQDLSALWSELASGGAISRALMSNLVSVRAVRMNLITVS